MDSNYQNLSMEYKEVLMKPNKRNGQSPWINKYDMIQVKFDILIITEDKSIQIHVIGLLEQFQRGTLGQLPPN